MLIVSGISPNIFYGQLQNAAEQPCGALYHCSSFGVFSDDSVGLNSCMLGSSDAGAVLYRVPPVYLSE